MPGKKTFNLFYVLLIPAGFVFAVTAFAYGYMAFQAVNAIRAEAGAHAGHPLFQWLRAHGDAALLIQLALLAVLTVAAIATDNLWNRAVSREDSAHHAPRDERAHDSKEVR